MGKHPARAAPPRPPHPFLPRRHRHAVPDWPPRPPRLDPLPPEPHNRPFRFMEHDARPAPAGWDSLENVR